MMYAVNKALYEQFDQSLLISESLLTGVGRALLTYANFLWDGVWQNGMGEGGNKG